MAGINAIQSIGTEQPMAQALRERASEFVGVAFFGPLLRQARQSFLREGCYFSNGPGQEAFEARLHEEFARRVGRASSFKLTDAIVNRLLRRTGGSTDGG